MARSLIIISGLSGAGKSTIGPMLADYLDADYIDQDKFFRRPSTFPLVATPKGKKVRLYDHESCIDFDRMTNIISDRLKRFETVVLSGFYLPPKFFSDLPLTRYIVLDIDYEVCLARRAKSKAILAAPRKFDTEQDRWMVETYVLPFYREGLDQILMSGVKVDRIQADVKSDIVWSEVKKLF